jgi:hypothetical protein
MVCFFFPLQHWVYWVLCCIIYFDLLFIEFFFHGLTQLEFFILLLIGFFFSNFTIEHWTDWELIIHNLFWFSINEIISVSWQWLRVWRVNPSWIGSFVIIFLIDYFLKFYPPTLGWLRIELLDLFFMRLFESYDLNRRFDQLTEVDLSYFFVSFCVIDFFY